jgi:hypothetical protein
MIVDERYRANDLLVGTPFLANDEIANQISDRFRAIAVPSLLNRGVKPSYELRIDRYPEPVQVRHLYTSFVA